MGQNFYWKNKKYTLASNQVFMDILHPLEVGPKPVDAY